MIKLKIKYFLKDTPQLELLFRTVLYHSTCPSGHKSFCQKNESTVIVRAAEHRENCQDYLRYLEYKLI